MEIPAQGLDLLRHVQQSFPSGWPDGELPPPVRRACARAIDGFVQYHLGLAREGTIFVGFEVCPSRLRDKKDEI